MEIPGGRGEQPEALWNGKSGGVGAQTVNNPPWGGVWIFSGTTQFYTKGPTTEIMFLMV